jgi:hypothetical protein
MELKMELYTITRSLGFRKLANAGASSQPNKAITSSSLKASLTVSEP